MLFFCFSSKDRHTIVESMLFHISDYAFPIWYDRHKMLMGDDRNYMNFVDGVEYNKYALIILSRNAINSSCAREEIEIIEHRHHKGQMIVFPIFFNIKAPDIPSEFQWMTKLVYKELDDNTSSLSACNHIVCRLLLDELTKYKIKSINDFLHGYKKLPSYDYLIHIIQSYCLVSDDNHNAQVSLLYAACMYLQKFFRLSDIPEFYYRGIDQLFCRTRLNLPIDLRETLIFERLFLLLLNSSISGYVV